MKDENFSAMVSSCVNLEDLSISGHFWARHLKIYSQSLKKFEICNVEMEELEIYAPNLGKIVLDLYNVERSFFSDFPSLFGASAIFRTRIEEDHVRVWCDFILSLSGVVRFTSDNMCLTSEKWLKILEIKGVPKCHIFKNLKFLKLYTRYIGDDLVAIAAFLELCPMLEKLVLTYHYTHEEHLCEELKRESLFFHMPNIKLVELNNYRKTAEELYLVEILKMHGVVLETIFGFPPWKRRGKLLSPIIIYSTLLHFKPKRYTRTCTRFPNLISLSFGEKI